MEFCFTDGDCTTPETCQSSSFCAETCATSTDCSDGQACVSSGLFCYDGLYACSSSSDCLGTLGEVASDLCCTTYNKRVDSLCFSKTRSYFEYLRAYSRGETTTGIFGECDGFNWGDIGPTLVDECSSSYDCDYYTSFYEDVNCVSFPELGAAFDANICLLGKTIIEWNDDNELVTYTNGFTSDDWRAEQVGTMYYYGGGGNGGGYYGGGGGYDYYPYYGNAMSLCVGASILVSLIEVVF